MSTVPLTDLASVLLALPRDLGLEAAYVEAATIVLALQARSVSARCPACGGLATRVHSHYTRTLADLAAGGVPVRLRVTVRRFRCGATTCPQRLFAERLPTLTQPRARRTLRAAARVTAVGLALGGEAGARLLAHLPLAVSPDTVLRHVHRAPTPEVPTPRVLGVDDWARRRGHTYGTLLIDLERRAPVDLLPDRDAATFADWLRAHPGVEVIARDRAEVYAEGGRRGAPDAVQVADRWHLLKNVGDALERVLQRYRAELSAAAPEPAASTGAPAATAVAPTSTPADEPAITQARRAARQALYDRIHALRAQGASLYAIIEQTGRSRATVRKYLRAASCPHRAPRRTKIGALTAFDAHLRARWAEGCDDAKVLWGELVARGFRGTLRTVQRHVAAWPTTDPHRRRARRRRPRVPNGAPAPVKPPSPRQARWWLVLPAPRLEPTQQRYIERLVGACPALANARALATDFGALVRAHDAPALAPWLERAAASEHAEYRDLATSLRRDLAAVTAAVREPWSNGQTEGQVNKLKMLKRQMYGRASVALLRKRMLHAA